MPLAKIHVVEGRYDEDRIAKVSGAVQAALMNTLRVPPEDFYQLIFEFPKKRFLHTPSFVGMHYTDDLIILDLTFIEGRSKETRLALLKDVNTRVAAEAGYDLEHEVWDLAVADRVREVVVSLPDDERRAIELAYFGGRTYREVAEQLGAPEGTIKSRIRAGLRRMRAALADPAMGVTWSE